MQPTTLRRRRRRYRVHVQLMAALASVTVVVAACGGGSGSPAVATVSSTTTTSSAGSAATSRSRTTSGSSSTTASPATSGLAYTSCMRSHGVPNFPDPTAGGGFLFQKSGNLDPNSPTFQAAQAKCRKLIPGGGPPGPGTTTHPTPQALARMVKAADCMRRHGVNDFPEPTTRVPAHPFGAGGAGVISDIDGVILIFPSTIDQQSSLFARAAAICAFPLHNH